MVKLNVEVYPETLLEQIPTEELIIELISRKEETSVEEREKLYEAWGSIDDFTLEEVLESIEYKSLGNDSNATILKGMLESYCWYVYQDEPFIIPQNNNIFDEDVRDILEELHLQYGYGLNKFLHKVLTNHKQINAGIN